MMWGYLVVGFALGVFVTLAVLGLAAHHYRDDGG